ncbi:hypothetical protein WJX72_012292 [[Myrmecia] bisecta]|uniref:Uncharacterized protein n=1 Tax=[Myrmecia] bisecta TaxID=41462 RepID=A0AAW1Q7F1_9CHLO
MATFQTPPKRKPHEAAEKSLPKVESDGPRSSRVVPLRELLEFIPGHKVGEEDTETRGTRLPLEKQLQAFVGFEARQGTGRKTDWSLRPKRRDAALPGVTYPIRSWPQFAAHLDEWLQEGEA